MEKVNATLAVPIGPRLSEYLESKAQDWKVEDIPDDVLRHRLVLSVEDFCRAHIAETFSIVAEDALIDRVLAGDDVREDSLDAVLNTFDAREVALGARLTKLRSESEAAASAALPALRERGVQLHKTNDELNTLAKDIGAASRRATSSTAELRDLYEAREKVLEARRMVEELLNLEECVAFVEVALKRGDYAAAVGRVAPLARAIEETADESGGPKKEGDPKKENKEGERAAEVVRSLRRRVSDELARMAATDAEPAAVCGLAKLMGPLGCADEGHAALLSYCMRKLDAAAVETAEVTPPGQAQAQATAASSALTSAPAALGRVLQRCAALLEACDSALDESMGGRDARLLLASSVRAKCVALGSTLGARYNAAASLKTLTDDASRRLQQATSTAAAAAASGTAVVEPSDPEGERAAQAAEPLVEGVVAMLRGVTQWDAYMRGKTGGDGNGAGESLRHAAPFAEMARAAITLSHLLAAVAAARAVRTYVAKSAASEAEGASGDQDGAAAADTAALSELVDSTFYVAQMSLRRATHTCDAAIACAAARNAAGVLTQTLLGYLQSRLGHLQSLSSKLAGAVDVISMSSRCHLDAISSTALGSVLEMTSGAVSSAADDAAALAGSLGGGRLAEAALGTALVSVSAAGATRQLTLLRTLSALTTCIAYTPRLWAQAADDFRRSLPPAALGAAQAQLNEAAAVQQAFEAARDAGLAQLSRPMLGRLQKRIDVFGSASYVLQSDASFAKAEADSFVTGLISELELLLRPLAPALIEDARDALLLQLVAALAGRLETLVLAKRFDQLGALQLDRELRAITKRLGELTSRSVREKLARLTQMATLLNLETEAEAAELWAEHGSGWRVTKAEAKSVLALRVDFRKEVINSGRW